MEPEANQTISVAEYVRQCAQVAEDLAEALYALIEELSADSESAEEEN